MLIVWVIQLLVSISSVAYTNTVFFTIEVSSIFSFSGIFDKNKSPIDGKHSLKISKLGRRFLLRILVVSFVGYFGLGFSRITEASQILCRW